MDFKSRCFAQTKSSSKKAKEEHAQTVSRASITALIDTTANCDLFNRFEKKSSRGKIEAAQQPRYRKRLITEVTHNANTVEGKWY
jgi:hypothetical protein